jgi:hypothetical protein
MHRNPLPCPPQMRNGGFLPAQKKRGDEGYNPCVKYDYIYGCLVHNMNYATEHADLDGTIDETTRGFSGYSGNAGGRLMNKPKSKGDVVYCFIKCLLKMPFECV